MNKKHKKELELPVLPPFIDLVTARFSLGYDDRVVDDLGEFDVDEVPVIALTQTQAAGTVIHTLSHEIGHAVCLTHSLYMDDEEEEEMQERVADAIGDAIICIVKHNPEIVKIIQENV